MIGHQYRELICLMIIISSICKKFNQAVEVKFEHFFEQMATGSDEILEKRTLGLKVYDTCNINTQNNIQLPTNPYYTIIYGVTSSKDGRYKSIHGMKTKYDIRGLLMTDGRSEEENLAALEIEKECEKAVLFYAKTIVGDYSNLDMYGDHIVVEDVLPCLYHCANYFLRLRNLDILCQANIFLNIPYDFETVASRIFIGNDLIIKVDPNDVESNPACKDFDAKLDYILTLFEYDRIRDRVESACRGLCDKKEKKPDSII